MLLVEGQGGRVRGIVGRRGGNPREVAEGANSAQRHSHGPAHGGAVGAILSADIEHLRLARRGQRCIAHRLDRQFPHVGERPGANRGQRGGPRALQYGRVSGCVSESAPIRRSPRLPVRALWRWCRLAAPSSRDRTCPSISTAGSPRLWLLRQLARPRKSMACVFLFCPYYRLGRLPSTAVSALGIWTCP